MSQEKMEAALKKALSGDFSERIDEDQVDPGLRDCAGLVNKAVGRLERMKEYERMLKGSDDFIMNNPQAIAVYDRKQTCLILNKEYERLFRGTSDELTAKPLTDFDLTVTGGAGLYDSIEMKKLAVTEMNIAWDDGTKTFMKLSQLPILKEDGSIDVVYYIFQDLTAEKTLEAFLNGEVDRLSSNLVLLARGETRSFDLAVADADEYTEDAHEKFLAINENLGAAQKVFAEMTIDFVETVKSQKKGEMAARAHPEKFQGVFAVLTKGVNDVLDAVYGPVNESVRLAGEYASKDFTAKFDEKIVVEGDFLGFKAALNSIGVEVGQTLADAKEALALVDANMADASQGIEEISKAMEQVAVNSQQSSTDSKKQLDAVEVVAREISDLSASIEEIASTSQEVKAGADRVSSMGSEASELGQVATRKMSAVEKISEQSVTEIDELNRKMREISNIVKLITDISNQTNLLALNAAIEAARAGEHGRGFAVVAGEVRNLAGESKAATDSIEQLIAGIQADSAKTAASMRSAYEEIQSGIESVNSTIEALSEMEKGAVEASGGIAEIAHATDDQANATTRVMQQMEETTRITKDNLRRIDDMAALTEEVAASAEEVGSGAAEVTHMTEGLRKMMDVFKVN